ncbi:glutathione S-transferase [Pseudomonas duriflava]|uniref:Glutathione S-transferase n=1 Tax=Pseudomonas duriflava TaxID=459528 RepID=A0A562QP66_9PSED|nr:glutathione S-transferase family protein [Pseudomonas duriflava]TWI58485.1 glutathione S-transferase [Pseudomonas duriflava]
MSLTLVVGNKNYSSWSLRAWLVMELSGARYDDLRIPLYTPDSRARLKLHSPTGKVPVLKTEHGVIWDSLAIAEYMAEQFPEAHLWPTDTRARAFARALCAEMHSGFMGLRNHLPMDMKRRQGLAALPPEAENDIRRICALWAECRERFGAEGPYLFGRPSIADAFYAPVASRLRSYAVSLPPEAEAYVETIYQWPMFRRWYDDALAEKEVIG